MRAEAAARSRDPSACTRQLAHGGDELHHLVGLGEMRLESGLQQSRPVLGRVNDVTAIAGSFVGERPSSPRTARIRA